MMNPPPIRILCAVVGVCVLGALPGRSASAEEPTSIDAAWEVEFIEGLRQRGLFRLAVEHVDTLKKGGELSTEAQLELSLQHSQTYAQWALASRRHRRPQLWELAHAALTEFLQANPNHPRRVLVQLQDALVWLTQGTAAKNEAVAADSAQLRNDARDALRQAIRALESLSDEVSQQLTRARMSRRQMTGAGELTVDELTSLANHIHVHLAEALRQQADTFEPGSPDRVNALTRALQRLHAVLRNTSAEDLRRNAQLDIAICHRRLGHQREAKEALTRLTAEKLPKSWQHRVHAERMRQALAFANPQQAWNMAQALQGNEMSPELLIAKLEIVAAIWQMASKTPSAEETNQWIDQARRLLSLLEQHHGPIWQRRGELLVGGMLASSNHAPTDRHTARMTAESLYLAGRFDEALAAYDTAAQLAAQSGDGEAAFDLKFAAAAIMQQQDVGQAHQRFAELARNNVQHPRAAEAHRLAILSCSQAARAAQDTATRKALLATYAGLLDEHITLFSDSESSHEVSHWQGNWQLQQGKPLAALQAFRRIPPGSLHFDSAAIARGDAYQRAATRESSSENRRHFVAAAVRELQPVITGSDNQWPAQWSDMQRTVALSLARLKLLDDDVSGAKYAGDLLTVALTAAGGSDQWRYRAAALLIEALAVQGIDEKSESMLEEFRAAPIDLRIETVGRLVAQAERVDDPARRTLLGELALRIGEVIDDGDLPSADLGRKFIRDRNQARAAAGKRTQALAAMKKYIAANPTDGDAYQQYADLLAAGDAPTDWQEALRAYQKMEGQSKPGGQRWLHARRHRIEMLIRLGDREQATKLLRLTRIVHPNLGAAAQESFAELERQFQ